MNEAASLWGLFLSSFLASTLLPGGSEGVLVWMHQKQLATTPVLLGVATLGNTLGGLTSWGIGYWLRRRFPLGTLEQPRRQQALHRLEQHGAPLLLLSWLPLVGDPLCVAAGWLRIRWWVAAFFIALGKGARYALLLWVSSQAM
jgi:membrane protein YqaA with SNARE-associated domain